MLQDVFARPLKDLRISVTDRCNFRCTYCMPFDEYPWIPNNELLSYDEIGRLARLLVGLGVNEIRLTGGEPLIRPHLDDLIKSLSSIPGVDDLSLTTNGSLLVEKVASLRAAGLQRVNISLDTLNPEKFRQIRRRGDLAKVLEGLFAAKDHGLRPIKLNAVIQRGVNDDDIVPLVDFARRHGFAIRFIEFMDVGNANGWVLDRVVSKREMLDAINRVHPLREIGRNGGRAPAVDYQFVDGAGEVGVIASVTEPFCASCTRLRLTADGKLVTCLFAEQGHDLKTPLRRGDSDDELVSRVAAIWGRRHDRYSAERLAELRSPSGYDAARRHKIEMITLGG